VKSIGCYFLRRMLGLWNDQPRKDCCGDPIILGFRGQTSVLGLVDELR
jgi:hypothetical protein